ncbi:FAS1 domain-containing protein [Dichotomopilus funicola]|uniref:FAS1 domain-containing protein n=1 Tax=Dichotomopilus funicola TaxID=1934379 RepID=A0AAN6UXR0_9PEZI|nr:FAS1 domain-containing protein [Dichotomopilus funicola]
MHPSHLLLLAGTTVAQSLQDVLTAQSATLSTLNGWLASEALIFDILNSAQGITILAPSNNALAALYSTTLPTQLALDSNLLTAFLSYHVLDGVFFASDFLNNPVASAPTFLNMQAYSNVSGGQVVQSRSQNGGITFFSGNNVQSNVQAYDFNYVGGTLHIIDTALTIPARITDTLITTGLTACVGALQRAGIEAAVNNAPDITLFVPTNAAFDAIGSILNGMTLEQLTTVLNYHVVRGQVLYSQLIKGGGTVVTAEGAALNFRVVQGALFVNSARVVVTDVLVGNGVVHFIDGVLNPANPTATPDPSAATQAPAFSGANTAAGGVPFTSSIILSTTTTLIPTGPTPTASSGATPPPPVVTAGRPHMYGNYLIRC